MVPETRNQLHRNCASGRGGSAHGISGRRVIGRNLHLPARGSERQQFLGVKLHADGAALGLLRHPAAQSERAEGCRHGDNVAALPSAHDETSTNPLRKRNLPTYGGNVHKDQLRTASQFQMALRMLESTDLVLAVTSPHRGDHLGTRERARDERIDKLAVILG